MSDLPLEFSLGETSAHSSSTNQIASFIISPQTLNVNEMVNDSSTLSNLEFSSMTSNNKMEEEFLKSTRNDLLLNSSSTSFVFPTSSSSVISSSAQEQQSLLPFPHFPLVEDQQPHPQTHQVVLNLSDLQSSFPNTVVTSSNSIEHIHEEQNPMVDQTSSLILPTESISLSERLAVGANHEVVLDKGGQDEIRFMCAKCELSFSCLSSYKTHAKNHQNDRSYRCSECPDTFNVPVNLTLHEALHCIEDENSSSSSKICPVCGIKFVRVASFKSHLRIHEESDNLSCPKCELEFANEFLLSEHLITHRNSSFQQQKVEEPVSEKRKKFECNKCDRTFKDQPEYLNHQLEHRKIRTLMKSKQKRRKRGAKQMFRNVCKFCSKTFRKPSQCLRHERIHTGEKPYKCTECPKAFNQKNSLDIHVRKHNGQKPYECKICSLTFTQNGNLRTHILRVHSTNLTEKDVFKCEECPCAFKKIGSLNAHIGKLHYSSTTSNKKDDQEEPDQGQKEDGKKQENRARYVVVLAEKDSSGEVKKHLVRVSIVNGEKLYSCQQCQKEFKKPSDLVRHMNVHSSGKNKTSTKFSCRFCPSSFTKSALAAHERIHHNNSQQQQQQQQQQPPSRPLVFQGDRLVSVPDKNSAVFQQSGKHYTDRPHRCDKCPAGFKKSSHLKEHLMIHEKGSHNISCSQCNKTFHSPGSLRSHITLVHNDHKERFQCETCQEIFATPSACKRHMVSHSQEKPFFCPHCNKAFKTVNSCKKHIILCSVKPNRDNVLDNLQGQVFNPQNVGQPQPQPQPHYEEEPKAPQLPSAEAHEEIPVVASISESGVITINPSELGLDVEDFQLPTLPKVDCDVEATKTELNDKKVESVDSRSAEYTEINFTNANNIFPTPNQTSDKYFHDTLMEKKTKKEIPSLKEIELPISTVHKHQCTDCSKTFKKNCDLIRHTRTHTGEKPFPCNVCSRRFALKSTLEDHMKTHEGIVKPEVTCHICNSSFGKKSSLKTHMRLHTGSKPYKCSECQECFRTPSLRRAHVKNHLKALEQQTSPAEDIRISVPASSLVSALNSVKEIGCPLIGSVVRLQLYGGSGQESSVTNLHVDQELLDQLQKGGNVNLVIDPTNVTSTSPMRQQQHQQDNDAYVMSDILSEDDPEIISPDYELLKPIPEEDSDIAKAGEEEETVGNKEIVVENSDPKKCSVCQKTFQKPSMLTRHMRIHTGEKPFACGICNKAFNQKNSLNNHMKRHTGERKFGCPFCQFFFTVKCNLKTHIERAHSTQAQMLIEHTKKDTEKLEI